MALDSISLGVPDIEMGRPDKGTTLPSVSAITLAVSAVDEDSPGDFIINDVQSQISTGVSFQFVAALMGFNASGKGYSVTRVTLPSGTITLSDGEIVHLHIANGTLPSGYDQAICMVIFAKKGNSSVWKMYGAGQLKSGEDFDVLIGTEPLSAAEGVTLATLQSSTPHKTWGDRTPVAVLYDLLPTTEGGVTANFDVDTVKINPDNSKDYSLIVSHSLSLTFSILSRDLRNVVFAGAGNAYRKTISGTTFEITQLVLLTAQALSKGNAPIKFQLPADENGPGDDVLVLGNLTTNTSALALAFKKDEAVKIPFNLQTASQDRIFRNQHSVIASRSYDA